MVPTNKFFFALYVHFILLKYAIGPLYHISSEVSMLKFAGRKIQKNLTDKRDSFKYYFLSGFAQVTKDNTADYCTNQYIYQVKDWIVLSNR